MICSAWTLIYEQWRGQRDSCHIISVHCKMDICFSFLFLYSKLVTRHTHREVNEFSQLVTLTNSFEKSGGLFQLMTMMESSLNSHTYTRFFHPMGIADGVAQKSNGLVLAVMMKDLSSRSPKDFFNRWWWKSSLRKKLSNDGDETLLEKIKWLLYSIMMMDHGDFVM